MSIDLTDLVETTIDATIRSFNPDNLQSFDFWDAELQRVQGLLSTALSEHQALLASIRAQRIAMAYDVGKIDLVIEQSAGFVEDFAPSEPSFFGVATLRARALHVAGCHKEELVEALQLARDPGIQGSEFVLLLEGLAKRHPGSVPIDDLLTAKMRHAVLDLHGKGYDTLLQHLDSAAPLERTAVLVASELRRVNRAKTEELLANGTD